MAMHIDETKGRVKGKGNEEKTVPAEPKVETGAMDEAPSQTKEDAEAKRRRTQQPAPWATGQNASSWQASSWDAPSFENAAMQIDKTKGRVKRKRDEEKTAPAEAI